MATSGEPSVEPLSEMPALAAPADCADASVNGMPLKLPAVPFLYQFLSLMRRASATPGQAFMGLTVRRDADLGPPTGLQALLFTAIFYVTMAATGLLLLVALFTTRHRTLHDMASDLVVVRRRALDAWVASGRG